MCTVTQINLLHTYYVVSLFKAFLVLSQSVTSAAATSMHREYLLLIYSKMLLLLMCTHCRTQVMCMCHSQGLWRLQMMWTWTTHGTCTMPMVRLIQPPPLVQWGTLAPTCGSVQSESSLIVNVRTLYIHVVTLYVLYTLCAMMRNGYVYIHTCNRLLYELSVCVRMYCTTDNVTLNLQHCVHTEFDLVNHFQYPLLLLLQMLLAFGCLVSFSCPVPSPHSHLSTSMFQWWRMLPL